MFPGNPDLHLQPNNMRIQDSDQSFPFNLSSVDTSTGHHMGDTVHHFPTGVTPSTPKDQQHSCEAFVGNLSYFCREKDLYELFNQYAFVTNVRIMLSEDRTRSLMFGFVAFSSEYEVTEMVKLMNGNMFMGRRLRVCPSDRHLQRVQGITSKQLNNQPLPGHQQGYQLHVAVSSSFAVRCSSLFARQCKVT